MQWSAAPGAGFTTGEPWLPIAEDHERINVERERDDPDSYLSLYRRMIELRRSTPALAVGDYRPVEARGSVLAYERGREGERWLVVLNLGPAAELLPEPPGGLRGTVAVCTHREREGERVEGEIALRADEGLVLRLDA